MQSLIFRLSRHVCVHLLIDRHAVGTESETVFKLSLRFLDGLCLRDCSFIAYEAFQGLASRFIEGSDHGKSVFRPAAKEAAEHVATPIVSGVVGASQIEEETQAQSRGLHLDSLREVDFLHCRESYFSIDLDLDEHETQLGRIDLVVWTGPVDTTEIRWKEDIPVTLVGDADRCSST